MAYITKWTASQILWSIEKFDSREKDVYKMKLDHIFNLKEKSKLRALRSLFCGDSDFMEFYHPVEKAKDNYELLYYLGGTPAYHEDPSCISLNSDFTNYIIPHSIREKGKTEVRRFRKWFKENIDLKESNPILFDLTLGHEFGVRFEDLKELKTKNTGIYEIENLSANEIEKRIDELIKETNEFFFAKENNQILYRLGKVAYVADSPEPIRDLPEGVEEKTAREILRKYEHEYREPLYQLLQDYLRIKFNPDLSIDKSLLEQLGLKPCKNCCRNETNTTTALAKTCDNSFASSILDKNKQIGDLEPRIKLTDEEQEGIYSSFIIKIELESDGSKIYNSSHYNDMAQRLSDKYNFVLEPSKIVLHNFTYNQVPSRIDGNYQVFSTVEDDNSHWEIYRQVYPHKKISFAKNIDTKKDYFITDEKIEIKLKDKTLRRLNHGFPPVSESKNLIEYMILEHDCYWQIEENTYGQITRIINATKAYGVYPPF